MTARKYTVSKRGVKREVKRARQTARERLLATLDGLALIAPHDAYKRRVRIIRALRAYKRELALRAAAVGANAARASEHRAVYAAIRAAILGPSAAGPRKRGER